MVPHTRRSGCVALLDPFSLRETPVELCAEGEIQGACAATQDLNLRVSSTPTTTNQVRRHTHFGGCIRAAPAALLALLMVLSPSAKPDPENAQTMHHEIQECAATQDPDSRVPTTHTTTKRVWRHTPTLAGFLTPQNPHPKNPRTRLGRNTGVRAATQDLNPRVSPTPTTTNQVRCHTPTSVLSPSAKPNPENAQTTHHETQECAATQDPDSRVPTTHTTAKQIFSLCKTPIQRIHGQGPGEIQACAQPPKTLTLDYSQPIQRGGLKYGATHPPKRVLSPSAQPHLKNATQDPNPEYQ
ncbi:hypothetical protein BS47DRAFT_1360940 [Hydnum rufescens UP504]|uniref:Uncharacterized protein n=1 Tax=Hydnum rufescens UP504 TaxID=1448309 RepID=A0A9P6B186_9AGAM|nr:hypothetical protein BS47DRAFT_1360940 [Hydnum rufescens UP504]